MNSQVNVSNPSRLQYFPVALFSAVMGLAGLAMALQQSEAILGLPQAGPQGGVQRMDSENTGNHI